MTKATKEKIREIAHDLFAKKGYEAVSIRDIAKGADVNLAAINYHFENKLSLYHSVIDFSMNKMMKDLEDIEQNNPGIDTIDYVGLMFDYLIDNESRTLSCFKFFMSMSEILKEIEIDCLEDDKPPGGQVIERLLKKDIEHIKEQDMGWIIRSICALTFHKAIVACNKNVLTQKKKYGITKSLFKEDLCRATRVMIDSLK